MSFTNVYVAPKIEWTKVVLNDNLQWEKVDPEVQLAFKNGIAKKVLVPAGTELYKFTAWDIVSTQHGVTPWWSSRKEYDGAPGLDAVLAQAKEADRHPSDHVREMVAVRPHWNSLSGILLVRLLRDVWGFWGKAGWQPKLEDIPLVHMVKFDQVLTQLKKGTPPTRIGFRGEGGQFFIPGLLQHKHVARQWFYEVEDIVSGEDWLT